MANTWRPLSGAAHTVLDYTHIVSYCPALRVSDVCQLQHSNDRHILRLGDELSWSIGPSLHLFKVLKIHFFEKTSAGVFHDDSRFINYLQYLKICVCLSVKALWP